MQITSEREGGKLTVAVSGRIDTTTAPELSTFLDNNFDGVTELVLDLKDMPYTSSSGLRVLLKAQKVMNGQGSMKIINVQSSVEEIFDITGFSDILTIE